MNFQLAEVVSGRRDSFNARNNTDGSMLSGSVFNFIHYTADVRKTSPFFRMFFITLAGIIFSGFNYLKHNRRFAIVFFKISDDISLGIPVTITNLLHNGLYYIRVKNGFPTWFWSLERDTGESNFTKTNNLFLI